MFGKKKKSTVKPNLPKEYTWNLLIDGEEKVFKCLVTETEVITYEEGREHKHLKIMDPTCMEGVLQIDTVTKIFGEMIDFQLERFIPYIRLEGKWTMSDTTQQDRMEEQIAIYKKQSKQEAVVGVLCELVVLAKQLVMGDVGDWWMLNVFGILFIASALLRMARLRNEINAMKDAEEEALAEKEARRALREVKKAEE